MVPSSQEILDATKEILSQPEFQQKQSETDSVIQRFFYWLFMKIPPEVWKGLFWSVTIIVGLYLIWFILSMFHKGISRGNKISKHETTISKTKVRSICKPEEHVYTFDDVRKSLEKNDIESAIRELHAILLGFLECRGLITRKNWKTNSHYVVECQSKNNYLSKILQNLNCDYDLVLFGKIALPISRIEHHMESIKKEVEDEKE